MTNKYDCDDQLAAFVGLLKGTHTYKTLNRTLHLLSRHVTQLVSALLSALVSTIFFPMQRDSGASLSYQGQARRTSGHSLASITILSAECVQVIMNSLINNHKYATHLVFWVFVLFSAEKVRLLWIFLKVHVCSSVRFIQSSVIMLLSKSWSFEFFFSKRSALRGRIIPKITSFDDFVGSKPTFLRPR